MNRVQSMLICVAFMLHGVIHAQVPPFADHEKKTARPLLFASLPEVIEVDFNQLQEIFSTAVDGHVSAQLSPNLLIEGTLVDKTQHNPGSLSVNIRVSNYANALFNLSLRLQADNSSSIRGRMLHPKFGDVLLLYKEGQNYFIKKNTLALLMPD